MSKYSPLQDHLAALKSAEWSATFSDVEKILDGILPKSAYEYQAWWSNNPTGHSHARSWVEAGWKTEDVNIDGRRLVFRRASTPRTADRSVSKPARSIWGVLKGTVTVSPGVDLTESTGETWTGHAE